MCREIGIPFQAGQPFEKTIQPFIHPGPLPLIGIDNHGEEIVTHFMNYY